MFRMHEAHNHFSFVLYFLNVAHKRRIWAEVHLFSVSFFQNYDYDSEYGGHTGDPNLDNDYGRPYANMPEMVQKFLMYFRTAVNEGLVFELQNLYEQAWPKFTEDYFEKKPWPEVSEVAALVDNERVRIFI